MNATAGTNCVTPASPGFSACKHCRGWNDLARALQFCDSGVAVHRLRRGLKRIRPAPSLRSMVDDLARRVAELEATLG